MGSQLQNRECRLAIMLNRKRKQFCCWGYALAIRSSFMFPWHKQCTEEYITWVSRIPGCKWTRHWWPLAANVPLQRRCQRTKLHKPSEALSRDDPAMSVSRHTQCKTVTALPSRPRLALAAWTALHSPAAGAAGHSLAPSMCRPVCQHWLFTSWLPI
jgi:hypothetical protein